MYVTQGYETIQKRKNEWLYYDSLREALIVFKGLLLLLEIKYPGLLVNKDWEAVLIAGMFMADKANAKHIGIDDIYLYDNKNIGLWFMQFFFFNCYVALSWILNTITKIIQVLF